MGRAKLQEKNDEFAMRKAEGMTNDQTTKHDDVGCSSLGLWVSFVIRLSSFSFFIHHSSFPVARHDRTEEQLGQRICRAGSHVFLRKRPLVKSKEFRVP